MTKKGKKNNKNLNLSNQSKHAKDIIHWFRKYFINHSTLINLGFVVIAGPLHTSGSKHSVYCTEMNSVFKVISKIVSDLCPSLGLFWGPINRELL